MITLNFSFAEMMIALERMGFEIKLDTVEDEIYHNGVQTPEIVKHKTWNIYYKGKLLTEDNLFPRQYGVSRLETVFKDEMKARLLKLFQ